jgi:iron(III) transport system permease protein
MRRTMQTTTTPPRSESPAGRRFRLNWPRGVVVTLAALAIFLPLLLIFYQSFLTRRSSCRSRR